MIKNYKALLNKILTQEEMTETCQSFSNEQEFVTYLLSLPTINRHDWSEENLDAPIHVFINQRLQAFGLDIPKLDRNIYWENFTQCYPNAKRGEWLIFALACYDCSIRKHGFRLVLADVSDDTYRIIVVEKQNAAKLHQIKSEHISFKYAS